LQNRWESVRFGRFPVEPVRPGTLTGLVPTPKLCLQFLPPSKPAGLTGLPAGFFEPWEPALPRSVNLSRRTSSTGNINSLFSSLHMFMFSFFKGPERSA
jgi:hypothetical protein